MGADGSRREKRKEQNRRAAKKCREKRKRAVDQMALVSECWWTATTPNSLANMDTKRPR